jgi:hypothetical protein
MTVPYRWASGVMAALFVVTLLATYYGWGLTSDAEASAEGRRRSVRAGSLHRRGFYGGGPGVGK